MQAFPHYFLRSGRNAGFTLLELLVSTSILTIIVVLVSSLMNSATTTIQGSTKRSNADSHARDFFNRLERDVKSMVLRRDINYDVFKNALPPGSFSDTTQTGTSTVAGKNDWLAFYAEVPGYFQRSNTSTAAPTIAEISPYSLVAYDSFKEDPTTPLVVNDRFPGTVMQRLTKGLLYTPNTANNWHDLRYRQRPFEGNFTNLFQSNTTPRFNFSATRDVDFKTVGELIFRFEYTYLLKSFVEDDPLTAGGVIRGAPILSIFPFDTRRQSNLNPVTNQRHVDAFRDVQAIVVAIAVLDEKSRTQLDITDYSGLIEAFPDAVDGMDIESRWLTALRHPSFASTAGVSDNVAGSVRIYQRYIYLNH